MGATIIDVQKQNGPIEAGLTINFADSRAGDRIVWFFSFWHGAGRFRLDDTHGNYYEYNTGGGIDGGVGFVLRATASTGNVVQALELPITVGGAQTVTITNSGPGGPFSAVAWLVRGTLAFNTGTTNVGTGGTLSVGPVTSPSGTLLLSAITDAQPDTANNITGTAGWNDIANGFDAGMLANSYIGGLVFGEPSLYTQYRLSTSSDTATWTEGVANNWAAIVLSFTPGVLPPVNYEDAPEITAPRVREDITYKIHLPGGELVQIAMSHQVRDMPRLMR